MYTRSVHTSSRSVSALESSPVRANQALGKLESLPEMSALDWRGTADATVRAALAGGARECDVLVLRHDQSKELQEEEEEGGGGGEGETRSHGRQAGVGGEGWEKKGSAWTRRFVGSVGGDGRVVLKARRDTEVVGVEDEDVVLL